MIRRQTNSMTRLKKSSQASRGKLPKANFIRVADRDLDDVAEVLFSRVAVLMMPADVNQRPIQANLFGVANSLDLAARLPAELDPGKLLGGKVIRCLQSRDRARRKDLHQKGTSSSEMSACGAAPPPARR